jgi:hypothetical protein
MPGRPANGDRKAAEAPEPAAGHVVRYEFARQAAISGNGQGWRHGLGVLAAKGVAVWMATWTAWVGPGVPGPAGTTSTQAEPPAAAPYSWKGGEDVTGSACTPFPSPAAAAVVAVLTQMTLAHARNPIPTAKGASP